MEPLAVVHTAESNKGCFARVWPPRFTIYHRLVYIALILQPVVVTYVVVRLVLTS